jgi:hypothetical protein
LFSVANSFQLMKMLFHEWNDGEGQTECFMIFMLS